MWFNFKIFIIKFDLGSYCNRLLGQQNSIIVIKKFQKLAYFMYIYHCKVMEWN